MQGLPHHGNWHTSLRKRDLSRFLQLLEKDGDPALGCVESSVHYCSHVIVPVSVCAGLTLLHRNPLCGGRQENEKAGISIR